MSEVRMMAVFESNNPDRLRSIIGHHMEYLVDFEDNRDIVTSVRGAKSYCIDDKDDGTKLTMVANLISDILGDKEPSDEELDNDDDAIEMYACLHNLKEAMERCGYGSED